MRVIRTRLKGTQRHSVWSRWSHYNHRRISIGPDGGVRKSRKAGELWHVKDTLRLRKTSGDSRPKFVDAWGWFDCQKRDNHVFYWQSDDSDDGVDPCGSPDADANLTDADADANTDSSPHPGVRGAR